MIQLAVKKGLGFILSLFAVVSITFFLLKALPGDPFVGGDTVIPQEVLDTLYNFYGLNDPLWMQYLHYLKGIFTFDFGPSIIYLGSSVREIILGGFSITALLGLQSLFLSLFLGVFLGVVSSFYRSKWQDVALMVCATLGLAIPNFVLATLLQYFLALKLHIFPIARWGSYQHSILPTLALSAMPIAYIARLIRTSMVEVLAQDYIKAAYAKGLSSATVLFRHALPNALFPLLSYLAPLFTYLLTGSFAVEKIFGIPGLGQWMVNSIFKRDYGLIMGLVIFYSMLLIVGNFVVDLLLGYFNPRLARKK